MKQPLKERVWHWFVYKFLKMKMGFILPFPLRILYAFIFPVRWLRWKLSEGEGYQFQYNLWIINGQKYGDDFFRHFDFDGERIFKIRKVNDIFTIEEIKKGLNNASKCD